MKFRLLLKEFYKNKSLVAGVAVLLALSLIALTSASAAISFGAFNSVQTVSSDESYVYIDVAKESSAEPLVQSDASSSSPTESPAPSSESATSSEAPAKQAIAKLPPRDPNAPPLEQFPDGTKVCYLTFDDGPSSNGTPQILDILTRYNIKATFFVVGYGRLDYLQAIVNQGSTVGLHTNSHVYASLYSSYEAYFDDLEAISNKVYDRIGIRSSIIRFPGGSSNISSLTKGNCPGLMTRLTVDVEAAGYRYFDWNIDSGDADQKLAPPQTILDNVIRQSSNKSQICILMHDTDAKTTTVDALPAIIEYLASQGFEFRALTMDSPVFHHQKLNN